MNICLTGIDGFLGWPTALKLSRTFPDACIIGIDNLARRVWVRECGGVSAIPIQDMKVRLRAASEYGFKNIVFIQGDLVERGFVHGVLKEYRPEVVLHLAAQPSAPYSQIDGEKAQRTQYNNNASTINLLWGLKELGLLKTHFIETTTTGVYGAPNFPIPEGFLEIERKGYRDVVPFPAMAGSWYHMSKSNDINNMWLASKQFGYPVSDVRTSIVYGIQTEETVLDERLSTRFDFDFYFGTVVNRFCAMAVCGYPLTIYGKGQQEKPMISLEDATQSLANLAGKVNHTSRFEVYNQMERPISIVELAHNIKQAAEEMDQKIDIHHVPNPRIEDEKHKMIVEKRNFQRVLGHFRSNLARGIKETLEKLSAHRDTIMLHRGAFMG